MKLKTITFGLENCDYITIDGKYIGNFLVGDITTSIRRIACNAIGKMDVCNKFIIEIHKDANSPHRPFEQLDSKENVFDRLVKYNDITSISFDLINTYYEENQSLTVEHYDYYVSWIGDSDENNESQKSYISDEGNLYIVISEKQKIEDFFDYDEINDTDIIDLHFDMLDVGDEYGDTKRYDI